VHPTIARVIFSSPRSCEPRCRPGKPSSPQASSAGFLFAPAQHIEHRQATENKPGRPRFESLDDFDPEAALRVLSGHAFKLQAESIENRKKTGEFGIAVFGEHAVKAFPVKVGSLSEMSDAAQGLSNIAQGEQKSFVAFSRTFREVVSGVFWFL
jgi:hypothetical protein